jgi:hypothetical protein
MVRNQYKKKNINIKKYKNIVCNLLIKGNPFFYIKFEINYIIAKEK